MTAFVDSSGFLAVANPEDLHHKQASTAWRALVGRSEEMVTTNYVVLETVAILHHRSGVAAVRRLSEDLLGVVTVDWVDPDVHAAALSAVMAGGRRGPSLVDCSSFEIMRRRRMTTALAFDAHFTERGYSLPTADTGE